MPFAAAAIPATTTSPAAATAPATTLTAFTAFRTLS